MSDFAVPRLVPRAVLAFQWRGRLPLSITDKILADHAARKDASGVTWFTIQDLHRLGIAEPLFTAMQDVQHDLRMRRSHQVVESEGFTDRWSLQEGR